MAGHNPDDRIFIATLREKYAREKCCLICLKVVAPDQRKQHKQTVAHRFLVCCLKREIYPYPCIKCEMRFSTKGDLLHHSLGHSGTLAIEGMFSPVCCYLCRLPFISQEELDRHSNTSVEHHCRRQMVLEMALRDYIVSELSDSNNVPLTAVEESIPSLRSVLQENSKTNLLCTHSNARVKLLDSQNFCLICCNTVNETFDSDQYNTEESFLRKTTSSEILVTNDKEEVRESACIEEEFEEVKTEFVLKTIKTNTYADEIFGSEQKTGKLPEMVPRKSLDLELSGMSNVSQATLKECIPTVQGETEGPFQSKNRLPELAIDDIVQIRDSTPAHVQEEFEEVQNLLVPDGNKNNSYNVVDSEQNTGCRRRTMAPREPMVLESLDINNVPTAALTESIPSPKSSLSAVQEGLQTKLISPTNPNIKLPYSQIFCSICSVCVPTNSHMLDHLRGKNHRKKYEALQAERGKSNCHVSTDEMLGSNQNSCGDPLDTKNTSAEICSKTELLPIEDAVKIGDSTFACLQDEFEDVHISLGKDLNDFLLECETCGGVFQTFNNNLDLSYDLHVQNDPQHALATAVPLERDAKQMAEVIKTSTVVKKRTRTRKKKVLGFETSQGDISTISCTICFQNISGLSSLAKIEHIEKCNSNSKALQKVASLITQEKKSNNQTAEAPSVEESKSVLTCSQLPKQVNFNSLDFFCEICNKMMTQGNKTTHLMGGLHKRNASKNFFCPVCSENMSESEKKSHLNSPKHSENASKNFFCSFCSEIVTQVGKLSHLSTPKHKKNSFCQICDQNMTEGNKIAHEMGKLHKDNAMTFFCTVCSQNLTQGEKNRHLISLKHKQNASLTFFCEICEIVVDKNNKSSHVMGKRHQGNASLKFFCYVCSKKVAQGEKESHFTTHGNVFYCKICDRAMDKNSKKSHVKGKLHKEIASSQQSQ